MHDLLRRVVPLQRSSNAIFTGRKGLCPRRAENERNRSDSAKKNKHIQIRLLLRFHLVRQHAQDTARLEKGSARGVLAPAST
jgi:hypothetical protein